MPQNLPLQIISAPSILGLWPSGVESLPEALLSKDLKERLQATLPVIPVDTLNKTYSAGRDQESGCLNTDSIKYFSERLAAIIEDELQTQHFPLVFGGDCSVLIGIMPAVKTVFNGGLIFIDAHADFYAPHQSTTGQVADMDLAIVTGRGPKQLTSINGHSCFVTDAKVLHLAQRDQDETRQYGSQQISDSGITCVDLKSIQTNGLEYTKSKIESFLSGLPGERFWIHFDTDSLDDAINPAVDYRLPGGLSFEEAAFILATAIRSGQVIGMSVTIFNPSKDPSREIAEMLVNLLEKVLDAST